MTKDQGGGGGGGEEEEEEDIVCLDESFFINDDYQLTTFTFGSHVLQLLCLHSASTDFDLTGQLVWPGATILNNYLSNHTEMLQGCSVLELGSGVGVTGILCSRFCSRVVLTDHNDEVLKILNKNIEIQSSSENPYPCAELHAEKLDWGNSDQANQILQKSNGGFDLILGADIYILLTLLFCVFIFMYSCCNLIVCFKFGKRKLCIQISILDSGLTFSAVEHLSAF
ncbi:unnamed protein product [Linum tenue]|uniref:Methyltransferase family protein n=1 Tax=Linum tenue TaxID=586396 RepID=A0AAV0Q8U2_9ROSI|nr:unnamed protein product [Linum tenue]